LNASENRTVTGIRVVRGGQALGEKMAEEIARFEKEKIEGGFGRSFREDENAIQRADSDAGGRGALSFDPAATFFLEIKAITRDSG
jgi:hypothetical protein